MCVNCEADTYANDQNTECLACPLNSQAPESSDTAEACLCNAGYEGIVAGEFLWAPLYQDQAIASCRECSKGKYTSDAGNHNCQLCAVGTYSATVAQTVCDDCAANTYADEEGSSVCTNCTGFAVSPVGSTTIDQCACIAGYYLAVCTECAIGTYRNETHALLNTPTCTSCGEGMYTEQTASTSKTQCLICSADRYVSVSSGECLACHVNAGSDSGSLGQTSCTCNAGYTADDDVAHTCIACVAGK